jgi:hypothetical protein
MGRAEDLYKRLRSGGRDAILELVKDRTHEEHFLDFKSVVCNDDSEKLDSDARKNYAKAISGFGNSEGGVVVWGVDCSKDRKHGDIASGFQLIEDARKFSSLLSAATSGCSIPPHSSVVNEPICVDSDGRGFVVTYVPRSEMRPLQAVMPGNPRYFMRSGSSFGDVPHGVLAGMFGRSPSPEIYLSMTVLEVPHSLNGAQFTIELFVTNQGAGAATDISSIISVMSFPGKVEVKDGSGNFWRSWHTLGRKYTSITNPDFKLPPMAEISAQTLKCTLSSCPSEDLSLHLLANCTGSAPYRMSFALDAKLIAEHFEQRVENNVSRRVLRVPVVDLLEKGKSIQVKS